MLGRSLLECAIIRFHQQRKYALDILRLLLNAEDDEDEDEDSTALEGMKLYVETRLLQTAVGAKRYNARCIASMTDIRQWLQKLGDKIAAAQALNQSKAGERQEEMETIEFARVSLIQQHELLGIILSCCIEKRQVKDTDFLDFVNMLKKVDKYDTLLGMARWPRHTYYLDSLLTRIKQFT